MTARDIKVVIRAFTKDGYHKDILIANGEQNLMTYTGVTEPNESIHSGLIGHGGGINPAEWPEMVRFEVVIKSW